MYEHLNQPEFNEMINKVVALHNKYIMDNPRQFLSNEEPRLLLGWKQYKIYKRWRCVNALYGFLTECETAMLDGLEIELIFKDDYLAIGVRS